MTIPEGHPRLWFASASGTPGAARLSRARAYAASNPVSVQHWSAPDKARLLALRSVVRGQSGNPAADTDCQQAVSWLRKYKMPVNGTASDEARWNGENAILVYDWCHYALSDADRSMLVDRWNGYISKLNAKYWGGPHMAANNYFWGYLRNSLLWGIASYHDNGEAQRTIAQGFIDNALEVRYRSVSTPPPVGSSSFSRWYEDFGVGGVPLEGTQYGPYKLSYPVIAFTTATDYGYDAWNAVPFWRDAVYYLHYAATPSATAAHDGADPKHELFPFNDDETFVNGGGAEGAYSDFLGAMILRQPAEPLAGLAQDWMQRRGLEPSWLVAAELDGLEVTTPQPELPLDYYAEGAQFLYGRRSAAPEATAFMLQLGGANAYSSDAETIEADGGVGHSHQDLGNFQLWRKGRWITRETTGYGIDPDGVVGWNNSAKVDPLHAVAHNTALFEGRGQIYARRGWAEVTRLQSTEGFAYAAVDMTESYRAPAHETWLAEDDWPFAEAAIREFIYLRDLDALLVLDRMTSGDDSLDPVYGVSYDGPRMPAEQVRKSFVLHATGAGAGQDANPFVLGPAQATALVGDQRMDLRTLLPADPAYRVVAEGGAVGQFRLEYDVSGSDTSYLLNVVSARDADDQPIAAAITDLGSNWEVTLSHPQRGTATIVLQKGQGSSGGSVRIGMAPPVPLRADRQVMSITPQGVFWDGDAAAAAAARIGPARSAHAPGVPPSPSRSRDAALPARRR